MSKDNEELIGKIILSDQVATQFLTKKESIALETGSAFCDQFLEDMRNSAGELPDGAEDLAVEKAEAIVPGYGTALEKWANGFRNVFTSGKG